MHATNEHFRSGVVVIIYEFNNDGFKMFKNDFYAKWTIRLQNNDYSFSSKKKNGSNFTYGLYTSSVMIELKFF